MTTIVKIAQKEFKFNYEKKKKKKICVKECPICNCKDLKNIANGDRYGFSTKHDMCMNCSTIFINPRMTKEEYEEFNKTGMHKVLLGIKHFVKKGSGKFVITNDDRKDSLKNTYIDQLPYAEEVILFLRGHVGNRCRSLDIGAFTGGLSVALKEQLDMRPFIVEPTEDAFMYAKKKGIDGVNMSFEDYSGDAGKFDIVFLCRTIDHLIDPLGDLLKIRELLDKNGYFYFDFLNFEVLLDKSGQMKNTLKLEHPYGFSSCAVDVLLGRVGFEAVKSEDVGFVSRYLCKKVSLCKKIKRKKETALIYKKVINRRGI